MHVWVLFEEMRRISLQSGMQRAEDLVWHRVFMDFGSIYLHTPDKIMGISETSYVMKTYGTSEKREEIWMWTVSLHNHPELFPI